VAEPADRSRARRTGTGLLAAVATLPALTAVLHPWRDQLAVATILLLYLLAVVIVGVAGTPASAAVAAVTGFLLVNWFYVPPYHTFAIGRRDNLVALVVFVAVAVTTGVLVDVSARHRVDAARAQLDRDAMAYFGSIPIEEADAAAVLAHIRRTFGLAWVALEEDSTSGGTGGSGGSGGSGGRRLLLASGRRPDHGGPLVRVPAGEGGVELVASAPAAIALDRTPLSQLAAVAERARQAEELVAEQSRMEETERARVALLAAVGHDLRTPLAAIKAAVSALRSPAAAFSAGEQAQLLADVETGADRLGELVANLLDLSRLQTGALAVQPHPVQADEVAARALLDTPPGRVALDVPEDLPAVLADPALLERVLANLVANAIAHGAGSPVEVTGSLRPVAAGTAGAAGAVAGPDRDGACAVVLCVVDHGPGVPLQRRGEMLHAFRRLDDSRTGGLGLGMAVVAGFCDAMSVGLELLDTPGGGLTVALSVPVASAVPR
jgi:K+-sensing histidine kinase KdpD